MVKIAGYIFDSVSVSWDNDNISSDVELPANRRNETEIMQPTELAETIKEMNSDSIDPDSRMSSIDTKARVNPMQMSAVIALDSLVAMKFLPVSALFITRQMKRLSVSLNGLGRKEMIEAIRGVKDAESKEGFMSKLGGAFSGGNK